jgi:hypothetical protein
MKRISIVTAFVFMLVTVVSCGSPTPTVTTVPPEPTPESMRKTKSGFYWPTGTDRLGSMAGWLDDKCSWSGNDNYFDNEFHTGKDIAASEKSPVYAIADGKVLYRSPNGWGADNVGLLIVHQTSDALAFTAVYGHIRSSLQEGDLVNAGEPIGTVGPWPEGSHLHFGIQPGTSIKAPYGRMPCPSSGPIIDTNDFVDPIDWITTRAPFTTIPPSPTKTHTPPAPVPTPTRQPTRTVAPTLSFTPTPSLGIARVGEYAPLFLTFDTTKWEAFPHDKVAQPSDLKILRHRSSANCTMAQNFGMGMPPDWSRRDDKKTVGNATYSTHTFTSKSTGRLIFIVYEIEHPQGITEIAVTGGENPETCIQDAEQVFEFSAAKSFPAP